MDRAPPLPISLPVALALALCAPAGMSPAAEPPEGEKDLAAFRKALSRPAEEVIARVGEPDARYTHQGVDHWLYERVVKEADGRRLCPEILLEKGKSFQMNLVPEEMMRKSIPIVKGFGDWTPPAEVVEKDFTVSDTGVVGKTRAEVIEKLGQPDGKRVFNGREVWEYRKVRLKKSEERFLTIYLELEGDRVVSSVGN